MAMIGWLLVGLAGAGIGFCLLALVQVERFARHAPLPAVAAESVTLLKPLHGAEPRLADNLQTTLDQQWDAPIQLVAGVQDAADPAIAVAAALRHAPGRQVDLVCDPTPHGANAKVANLINMMRAARHDLLVLSDSDMAVPPDYLRHVVTALSQPGVGAVTCLYRGRGNAGFWSVLAAAGLSYQFLPNVLVSLALGDERVCMGSTIALRRSMLEAIGGFEAFADVLADDHAIGAAVRARGLSVAIPPLVLTHGCTETSLTALVRHELRWAATVRGLASLPEYWGSALTMPLPFAVAAIPFAPVAGLLATGGALAARLLLARRIDRLAGVRTSPFWLLPLRDLLSFAIFLLSFGVRSVDWRGERLTIAKEGRIVSRPEPAS